MAIVVFAAVCFGVGVMPAFMQKDIDTAVKAGVVKFN